MPRPANLKSNTQLIARAKDEPQKEIIKYFKSVCVRDGLEYGEEIFKMIQNYWMKVHPPPGNPQLQITQYKQPKHHSFHTCEYCNCKAVYKVKTVFPFKTDKFLCRSHTTSLERRSEVVSKKAI